VKKSKVFNTVSELNKAYNEIRTDIIERHGNKNGTKVRLKNAIMLYQKLNNEWVRMCSTKTDMISKIKMCELYKVNAEFMLKARV
jgi:hypothetical protein